MAIVSIVGLNKADVLAALYNASKPQGLGFLHYDAQPMTRAQAQVLLDRNVQGYFDYVQGRVMKVDMRSDDGFACDLYDRDNGVGAAQRTIDALRQTQDVNAEEIELQHLESTRKSAQAVSADLDTETTFERQHGRPVEVRLGLADMKDDLKPILDDLLDDDQE